MISRIKKDWGWVGFWGAIILFLAIFLRTYNLLSFPIFADEAIHIRWAQIMWKEPTLRFLSIMDGREPLYMWVMIPFLRFITDPLLAGRLLSVTVGALSLLGVSLLTYILFKSKRAALLAPLFYAVSPFSVFFDRLALVDGMLSMFGVWALLFGVLTARTLRLDAAMFTGYALGGGWLTKSAGIFFLTFLPVTALTSSWPKNKKKRALTIFKFLGLWVISWSIAFAMYNIQRLGPYFNNLATGSQRIRVYTLGEVLQRPLDPLIPHLFDIGRWLWQFLPATLLLATFAGIFWGWHKYKKELLLLLAWIIFPLLVASAFAKVFAPRYILFSIPPLLVLSSAPAALFIERLRGKVFWVVLGLVILPALWIDYLLLTNPEKAPLPRIERAGFLEEWSAGQGIREVVGYVRDEREENPGQGIVVGTEGFFGTLPDGLQIYIEDLPNVTVMGVGIEISAVSPELIAAKKSGNKVYLVVNSTRFTGDPERLGLRLIEAYPKAVRPDGTQEKLLFFEVTDEALTSDNKESI